MGDHIGSQGAFITSTNQEQQYESDVSFPLLKVKATELFVSSEVLKQNLYSLYDVQAPLSFKQQLARTKDLAEALFSSIDKLSDIVKERISEHNQMDDDVVELHADSQECEMEDDLPFPYGVKVKGLPICNIKDLRLLIENVLGRGLVKFHVIQHNSPFVMICFQEEEHLEVALELFQSKPFGLNLKVMSVDEEVDLLSNEEDDGEDPVNLLREASLKGSPTNEADYKQRLVWKERVFRSSMATLSKVLEHYLTIVVKDRTDGLLFKVEPMLHTELVETLSEHYRTFTGKDTETGRVGLGFRALGTDVPSWVLRSKHMIKVVEMMEEFMLSSGRSLYSPENRDELSWVSLAVRSNFEGKVMLVMTVRIRDEQMITTELESLQNELTRLFSSEKGRSCNIVSAHIKIMHGKQPDVRHIWGQKSLVEKIGDIAVRIHSSMFFWSYPIGVKLLCETVESCLELTKDTAVLELGVNTGVVGMWLSKNCKMVYELDEVEENLMHLRGSALINKIKNMIYVHGSIERSLKNLAKELAQYERVVAVMNGTMNYVHVLPYLRALQKCVMIEKVVYLMTYDKNYVQDLRALCKQTWNHGESFVIVKVVPLDITPYSMSSKALMILARKSVLGDSVETRNTKPILSSTGKADSPESRAKRWKALHPHRDFTRRGSRNTDGLQLMPVKPAPGERKRKMKNVRKALRNSLFRSNINMSRSTAMQVRQAMMSAIRNAGLLESLNTEKYPPRSTYCPSPPPPPIQAPQSPSVYTEPETYTSPSPPTPLPHQDPQHEQPLTTPQQYQPPHQHLPHQPLHQHPPHQQPLPTLQHQPPRQHPPHQPLHQHPPQQQPLLTPQQHQLPQQPPPTLQHQPPGQHPPHQPLHQHPPQQQPLLTPQQHQLPQQPLPTLQHQPPRQHPPHQPLHQHPPQQQPLLTPQQHQLPHQHPPHQPLHQHPPHQPLHQHPPHQPLHQHPPHQPLHQHPPQHPPHQPLHQHPPQHPSHQQPLPTPQQYQQSHPHPPHQPPYQHPPHRQPLAAPQQHQPPHHHPPHQQLPPHQHPPHQRLPPQPPQQGYDHHGSNYQNMGMSNNMNGGWGPVRYPTGSNNYQYQACNQMSPSEVGMGGSGIARINAQHWGYRGSHGPQHRLPAPPNYRA